VIRPASIVDISSTLLMSVVRCWPLLWTVSSSFFRCPSLSEGSRLEDQRVQQHHVQGAAESHGTCRRGTGSWPGWPVRLHPWRRAARGLCARRDELLEPLAVRATSVTSRMVRSNVTGCPLASRG
jgi:hypothetical protein